MIAVQMLLLCFRNLLSLNPFAAVLTSYLVMRKLVDVCPSAKYTRHTAHSSKA